MRYLALLRGINVGGKNKIQMAKLKETFAGTGASDVRTYINSGNVIFTDNRSPDSLAEILEDAIEKDFDLQIKVLLRDIDSIRNVDAAIPDTWVTDQTMRTRAMFLWDPFDTPEVLNDVPVRDGVDDVKYVPGALIWRVDVENLTRSGMARLTGMPLYKAMTMRNSNTVRKLAAMMEELTE